jgi:hypothetical protein
VLLQGKPVQHAEADAEGYAAKVNQVLDKISQHGIGVSLVMSGTPGGDVA